MASVSAASGRVLEVTRVCGTGEFRLAVDVQRPNFDYIAGAEERTNRGQCSVDVDGGGQSIVSTSMLRERASARQIANGIEGLVAAPAAAFNVTLAVQGPVPERRSS
jgi:hypothetical protein